MRVGVLSRNSRSANSVASRNVRLTGIIKRLECFMDMSGVYNPSAIPVYVERDNVQRVVNPGETVIF